MTAFHLELPSVGGRETKITVDGRPVVNARSVAVKSELGQPTVLFLELNEGGVLEGDAIVHVVKDGPSVVEWLSHIDPEELERRILGEMDGLGSISTGAAVLEVLRRWAGGGH